MLLKDNQGKFLFITIILGVLAGIMFMGTFTKQTNFGDAALGNGTVSYFIKDADGNSLHYLPKENAIDFIDGLSKYSDFRKIIFIGNSQSHSINQMQAGDNTMSGYLFKDFLKDSILFLSASIPNANLQEQYLLAEYLKSNLSNVIQLVLPVFFDDLREDGIRDAYFSEFAEGDFRMSNNDEISKSINSFFDRHSKLKKDTIGVIKNASQTENNDFKALNQTTQDRVERNLNKMLFGAFGFWRNREELRGEYFTKLYLARNTMFNISAQTVRKMIPTRYERNIKALNCIIDEAANDSIKVLLMIPPLRTDIKYPYNVDEYDKFKIQLKQKTGDGIYFVDLEHVVDSKYWGYSSPTQLFKSKDYDFMHFQAEGHKLLADSLKPYINKLLR